MSAAAKVGIFMLIVLAILGFFVLKIEDISLGEGDTREIDVAFDSVAGLDERSAVRVAGVRVGTVREIKLTPDGRALVTLEVAEDTPIHRNATARVANLGLLGEKYVELEPGTESAGLWPRDQPITLGGSQPASIDDVTTQVSQIAEDVKAITSSLRSAMAGENQYKVEEIVENVRIVTDKLRMILEVNEGNVNATADNLRQITADLRVEIPRIANSLDRFANSLSGTVGENREDVRVVVQNLRQLSTDLKGTVDNLGAISGQIRSGEGTVGKLIYDDEAHDRLTGALESVEGGVGELRNTLGRITRLEMDAAISSEYLAGFDPDPETGFDSSSRTSVFLDIRPNPENNKFFLVGVTDDPRGDEEEKVIERTIIGPDGSEETTIERETRYERDFLLSAQAGWRLDELSLRAGLVDGFGGVGADYELNERTRVSGEMFDFGGRRGDNPQLRFWGRYVFRTEKPETPALFVTSGVHDVLNDTSFSIGGGIRWNEEDLKYLLGSIPTP